MHILILPVRESDGAVPLAGLTPSPVPPTPPFLNFPIVHRRNARFPRQSALYFLCRETYVCLRLSAPVASRHSLPPGKNGPLSYVNPDRFGEERATLGEDEMARCRKGKFRFNPSTVHAQMASLTGTYSLKNENKQTGTKLEREHDPSKAKERRGP